MVQLTVNQLHWIYLLAIAKISLFHCTSGHSDAKINVQKYSHVFYKPSERILQQRRFQRNDEEKYLSDSLNSRSRRSTTDSKKNVCTLFLQADYSFYKRFGTERASIDVMAQHVQKVNEIYRSIDFDLDGNADDISFIIKRVEVETVDKSSMKKLNYSIQGIGQPYLEFAASGDYSDFCLAYSFSMQESGSKALGEAVGRFVHNETGVCKKRIILEYDGRQISVSANVGFVTLINNGRLMLPHESHSTMAHELAHSFGSPHDPEDDKTCSPEGAGKKYLMHPISHYRPKENNRKFSPCTIRSIASVLIELRKIPGCLEEASIRAVCGNRIVEEGEECDCGWEEDCAESCCIPMKINSPQDEFPCTLRDKAECSPSQGTCCAENCTLSHNTICKHEYECSVDGICDGKSPGCPSKGFKQDNTPCAQNSICLNGECKNLELIACEDYDLQGCMCDSESRHCELCCKRPGDNFTCVSSFEWNEAPFVVPDFYLKSEQCTTNEQSLPIQIAKIVSIVVISCAMALFLVRKVSNNMQKPCKYFL